MPSPQNGRSISGNPALRTTTSSRPTQPQTFGTADNLKTSRSISDGHERDKFKTLYGALTLKTNPNENTELGIQGSAFSSREPKSYDIAGEYWLSAEGATNANSDGVLESMSVGRYHEHARNRLNYNTS